MKYFAGKVGQTYVTRVSSTYPSKLDGDMLSSRSGIQLLQQNTTTRQF